MTMELIESELFILFSEYCKYVVFWLAFFCVVAVAKVCYAVVYDKLNSDKLNSKKENPVLEELPGLSFILLHSLCWFVSKTYVSKIFFLYWGPLYLVTVYIVLSKKRLIGKM